MPELDTPPHPLDRLDEHAYALADGDIRALQTPALVIHLDRVRENVARLRLLREAVEAGYKIGDVAGLPDDRIRGLLNGTSGPSPTGQIDQILDAIRRMDGPELDRLLTGQALADGPFDFCRSTVLPLLETIGARHPLPGLLHRQLERLSIPELHSGDVTLSNRLDHRRHSAYGCCRSSRASLGRSDAS